MPAEIPAVHFAEALAMIGRATGQDVTGEPDLAPAHERWLGEWARREHGSDFLFVTGYPMAKRPFYTHPDPDRPGVLATASTCSSGAWSWSPAGSGCTGYADYLAALAARGEATGRPYAGYLDAFRYGMPPHGGFAIGLERFVARLLGVPNIREVTLFPRDLHRLAP